MICELNLREGKSRLRGARRPLQAGTSAGQTAEPHLRTLCRNHESKQHNPTSDHKFQEHRRERGLPNPGNLCSGKGRNSWSLPSVEVICVEFMARGRETVPFHPLLVSLSKLFISRLVQ